LIIKEQHWLKLERTYYSKANKTKEEILARLVNTHIKF